MSISAASQMDNAAPRVLLLRPGALGDVILTRWALAALHKELLGHELVLAAPGERGRFLVGAGFAEHWLDLDRADAAWLFADPAADLPIPASLHAICKNCTAALAFCPDSNGHLRKQLQRLGCVHVCQWPARPDENKNVHASTHLLAGTQTLLNTLSPGCNHLTSAELSTHAAISYSQETIGAALKEYSLPPAYAVLHPGSGSTRKNWPAERFIELGQHLCKNEHVVITAGEADGIRGKDIARNIPGATYLESIPLHRLAPILAGARQVIGNDCGILHLAAAVRQETSSRYSAPQLFSLFGPSKPHIWAPEKAHVLQAPNGDLHRISVEMVLSALKR